MNINYIKMPHHIKIILIFLILHSIFIYKISNIYLIHIQIKYVPINIKINPQIFYLFNGCFFRYDSVNTVKAELMQFTITGPKLSGVFPSK